MVSTPSKLPEQKNYLWPGADFAELLADLQTDEPGTGKFWRGSLAVTDAKFIVPEDGLYHVYDTELGTVVVAPHAKWGVIGATPGGWSDNTPMTATFNMEKMEFQVTEMTMLQNSWKFRYSDGWKIFMDADGTVKVNTNLGGTVEAPTPGGADLTNTVYGVYTVTLTWELGKGWVGSATKTGDGEPLPEYPEAVYLVGDGTAYGWDAPGGNEEAIFHKAAGGTPSEGIYWKIAHLEGGLGFKISAADWTAPNLGFAEVEEFDAEGIEVVDNGGNMSIGESGMYIIVLNLRDEMTKVSVKPAEVYGIGDAFGGWDEDAEANKFVVDNAAKTLTSPALVADGSIRMYAQHNWIQDWWNAEFNVFDGKILYRNDGGDQDAVAGTTGQVVTLMFDDNTGTIQ